MFTRLKGWLLASCALSGLIPLAAPAQQLAAGEVRDLHFGEALFHFYQDDHFMALSRLLTARDAGRIVHHEAEAELLAGGLYLQFGMHAEAERAFEALLADGADPALRDRVWFEIGRGHFRRGAHTAALRALEQVGARLSLDAAAERSLLMAQSYMALGEYQSAAAVLDAWQGPEDWLPFMRYNLGVAQVRMGEEAAGIRQLEIVGGASAHDEETRALKDRANLAIGYTWLQHGEPESALFALEQVRVDGASANRALLGVGWARAALDDPAGALVPWKTLWTRDRLDGAVQESLLAVPYAYARLEADREAAAAYERALAAFDDELERLDAVTETAHAGVLVDALLAADDRDRASWRWHLEELPEGPEARYLHALVASHGFHEGLANIRDLDALARHLDDWHQRLDVFEHMVDAQMVAAEQRLPSIDARLAAIDPEDLKVRRDNLAARLDEIARDRDVVGLASDEELESWKLLEALAEGPALAAAPEGSQERHRLLRGHLLWQMDREYRYRLWLAMRALAELDADLAKVEPGVARVQALRDDRPDDLDLFAERIAAIGPRIDVLRDRVALVRAEQAGQLHAMALDWLTDQRERLQAYQVQARFALATLYDRAATAQRAAKPEAPES